MAGKKAKGKKKVSKVNTPPVTDANAESASPRDQASAVDGPTPSEDSSNESLLAGMAEAAVGILSSHPPPSGSGVPRAAGTGVRSAWAENGSRESPSRAGGAESRAVSGPGGSREGEHRRKAGGERDRDKRDTGEREREKDKGPGDDCHNGERLDGSPFVRQSAEKEWSWPRYSTKQFRAFAQEFPPTLDVGVDEVSSLRAW